ncbi:MAG: DUF4173 domain-containing protein [Bacteroidia bacterium]|nr:DUF4173 domain-containing protein [Bacteroidia bacterium]
MKTKINISYLLILIGACLFQWLFWHETPGINLLFFTIFIVPSLMYLFRESLKKIPLWLSMFGLLSTSIAVTIHGSSFSVVMYVISLILFASFSQWSNTRSPVYAIPSSIVGMVLSPYSFFAGRNKNKSEKSQSSGFSRWFSIIILPILILIVFFFIFYFASEKFAEYSDKVLIPIQDLFYNIFGNITFASIFFFVHGILLVTWLVLRNKASDLSKVESKLTLTISRVKIRRKRRFSFTGLKKEYLSALVLLVLINLLVLAANIVDIKFLWFGFEFKEGMNLKQFVHEGTYLLILSILLSMGILLYIFRKNQNFFARGKILRKLAALWIVQNLILAISVGIRNYHYIDQYGLAYKRIGVFIFLMLVLFGLYTFFIKILRKKSGYYLINRNSWAMYIVLTITSLLSYDTIITKYNTKYCKDLDYEFLVNMSTKALPLIDINKLPDQLYYNEFYPVKHLKNPWVFEGNYKSNYFYAYNLRSYYVKTVFNFLYEWEMGTKLSWNYYDEVAYKNFISRPQLIEKYKHYKNFRMKIEQIENGNKNSVQKRTSTASRNETRYE